MRQFQKPSACGQQPKFSRFIMVVGTAALIAGIGATSAQAISRKLKRECRSDYKTFCPNYKVGTPKMRSCMRSNGRQLSWGCYQALKDAGYVRR